MAMTNVPGVIRAIDRGNGVCELVKEPDVLCVMPVRRRRRTKKLLSILGAVGVFVGAAAAIIYLTPALGTILFAVVAGLMFAALMTGED